jgi:hypothetical protein
MAYIVVRLDVGIALSPDENGILWRRRYPHVFANRHQARKAIEASMKYSNAGGYGWRERDFLIVALPKSQEGPTR